MLVTSNALQRTFAIRFGETHGTAFTIDLANRQYVVTARHVVEGIMPGTELHFLNAGKWLPLPMNVVGHGAGQIDVSVLAAPLKVSPTLPLNPTAEGLSVSDNVYFLGFPYGMHTDVKELNANFPVPFVKRATVSSMTTIEGGGFVHFLDGYNNPGFSGGPVVFMTSGDNPQVVSVISGFRFAQEPVFKDGQPTDLTYRYNTGIIIAYDILHVRDLIESNPIGFDLSDHQ